MSGARGPLLPERSEPNSPVRRALRLSGALAGVGGAACLCVGLPSLWAAASIAPWPWRGPVGEAGLAVFIGLVLFGGAGLVFTAFGCALLAMAWAALDVGARRRARSPDPEQLHRPRVPRA